MPLPLAGLSLGFTAFEGISSLLKLGELGSKEKEAPKEQPEGDLL